MNRKTLEKLALRKTTRPKRWLRSPSARRWLMAHSLVLVGGEWKLLTEASNEELVKVLRG